MTIDPLPSQPGNGDLFAITSVNPSVIADSACPIISTTLSPPAIAVAFDFVVSVHYPVSPQVNSARSEGRTL